MDKPDIFPSGTNPENEDAENPQQANQSCSEFKNKPLKYEPPVFTGCAGVDGKLPLEQRILCDSYCELPCIKVRSLHFHDSIELGVCLWGEGECLTEHGSIRTHPGDLELFFPYEPHYSVSVSAKSPSMWRFIQIEFAKLSKVCGFSDYSALSALMSSSTAISGIIYEKEHPEIATLIKKIIAEAISDEPHRYSLAMALLTELIITDVRESRGLESRPKNVPKRISEIMPALNYIKHNFMSEIQTDRLADICRMSQAKLRGLFRSTVGMTPKEYVTLVRISNAEVLLTSTDLTIIEIAFETGFGDVSSFYRAFTAQTSVSPSDYRKNAKSLDIK